MSYLDYRQEWKCPNCPTVCSTRRYLMVHYRTVHAHLEGGSEGGLPYHCQLCGKSFLKQSGLEVGKGSLPLTDTLDISLTRPIGITFFLSAGPSESLPHDREAVRVHVLPAAVCDPPGSRAPRVFHPPRRPLLPLPALHEDVRAQDQLQATSAEPRGREAVQVYPV